MTKTTKLRAAFIARGFAPIDHASQRECLLGKTTKDADLYIWLDKVGGARYSRSPRKGDSLALSPASIALVLAGKPSKLVAGGAP